MSENTNQSKWDRFLRKRHTGKLVSLLNAAVYSIASFFAIDFIKGMISSKETINQSIGIVLLLLFSGLLVWIRDLITDVLDMQSPVNKERDEHNKTKEELKVSNKDLENCRRAMHAIRSQLTNTMMKEPDDGDKLKKITEVLMKINSDLFVNNVSEPSDGDIQKDYMSLFGAG